MVTKVQVPAEDGLTNTPADNASDMERPSWLPEQFKDGEDLWKSYQELRKDHTKKAQELSKLKKAEVETEWQKGDAPEDNADKPDTGKEDAPEGDQPADMEQAKQLLPGFTEAEITDISNYAWENGELSEDHYAKLEKAGYSREVVDQFMQGQFAVVEGQRQALLNVAGGEKRANHMFSWAKDNLSDAQIDAYNAKLELGGADAMLAMESLVQRYEQSGASIGPSTVSGAAASGADGSVYRSTAQVVEAINDPRYKTDPAYRREVQDRIGRSKVL